MKILVLLFLVTATLACNQSADKPPLIPESRAIKFYENASIQFGAYEKAHGGFVQTPNVRMHYAQWGTPDGVPLIWAHGTCSSAYEMAPFADSLVAAGYRLISVDYYGHGLTPIPPGQVSLWNIADDIATLMDSLQLPKAVIGGWSRGGAVAAAFYDAYPDRTLGLVLEDGGSFSFLRARDSQSDEILRQLASLAPYVSLRNYETEREAFIDASQWSKSLDRDDPLWHFHTLGRISRGEDGKWMINRGLLKWLGEETSDQVFDMSRRPTVSTLFQASTYMLEPLIIFHRLKVPILIIDPVQAEDDFLASSQNEELQQLYPSLITHRIYENTSHAAKLEQPELFVKDMIAFFEVVASHQVR